MKSARSKQRTRAAAIELLGGRCAYCGIDDPIVLNVDHVRDDGARERLTLDSTQICARLVSGALPRERYQLLCCNCNWRKEYLRRTGRSEAVPIQAKLGNQNAGKVACIHGHPFDAENTYVRRDGGRGCKACNREAQREYAERQQKAG